MLKRISEVLRSRKDGDKGFSLVELAVVIVIIGILVAIAVPIFANMQTSARTSAVEAAVANGSAMAAAGLAADEPTADVQADLTALAADTDGVSALGLAVGSSGTGTTVDLGNYCVTATKASDANIAADAKLAKGPGC